MHRRSMIVWGLGAVAVLTLAGIKIRAATGSRSQGILASSSSMRPIARSDVAPDFTAPDMSGKMVSLSSFRGRLVVLNFWFTGCAPCREEMPSLDRLAKRLAGKGIEVVALSVDDEKKKVERFLRADPVLRGHTPSFQVLLDVQKMTPPRYGTFKYPETYIISESGRILARFVGPRDWSSSAAVKMIESLAR